eukprot:1696311-Pleurochrysis_carterae.AAC.3
MRRCSTAAERHSSLARLRGERALQAMRVKLTPTLANARPSAPHTPTLMNAEGRAIGSQQRRALLFSLLPVVWPAVMPVPMAILGTQQASAFDNRLPADEIMKKYPTPKTPGPQPQDLGLRADGTLKACVDSKPHCFSSSLTGSGLENLAEDEELVKEEWMVDPFVFTGGKSDADAYSQLEQVSLAARSRAPCKEMLILAVAAWRGA